MNTLRSLAVLALGCSTAAIANTCEVPANIERLTPPKAPPLGEYRTLRDAPPAFADRQLGVGHLHAPAGSAASDTWFQALTLPLSARAGDAPVAWLQRGWIVTAADQATPLDTSGMLETGYELVSFVVLAERPDGWMHIQLQPDDAPFSTAWVPACAREPSRATFTPWHTWLMSGERSPLRFRAEIAHNLRTTPNIDANIAAPIAGDYHLEPLELRGKWMRVRVVQPSDACAPEKKASRVEGWIQWFSPEKGPWVWYPSRGC